MINKALLKPFWIPELIRIGKHNDGGYAVPRSLIERADVLLSFGISDDWSFEEDFRKTNRNVVIEAYDRTTCLSNYRHLAGRNIRRAILFGCLMSFVNARYHFIDFLKWRRLCIQYRRFFSPHNKAYHFEKWVGTQADQNHVTLAGTLARLIDKENKKSIFLKMDIEGAEYAVIDQMLPFVDYIGCIVLEWHDIDRHKSFEPLFSVLLESYSLVHVHGNNCDAINEHDNFPVTIEVTLVNKSQMKKWGESPEPPARTYPINGLDEPNDPGKPDYPLEFGLQSD